MALVIPRSDSKFLAFCQNFSTLISATPVDYGVTSAQATAYAAVLAIFQTSLAACDPNVRNKTAVAAKNTAKAALKLATDQTASLINGCPTVTDAQKVELGIPPRATPMPIPAPSTYPAIDVVSVSNLSVTIKLHDIASGGKRGKPPGVFGASIFSYVGATPPADITAWTFQGNTGRGTAVVAFDPGTPAGAKVYLTAFWFNGRKQSGPACPPVATNLQGGSVSMAA